MLDFYIRRVRRLAPALTVVLIAVAVFGWFALSPAEYRSLQRHLGASALFANNIVLWREAGYFDAPSEFKPLLHLWSLGIEEQFYLVWPALIWWGWRRGFAPAVLIGSSMVASFIVNVTLVARGSATAAFYLPHARLWQLASGGLLSALMMRRSQPTATTDRDTHWIGGLMSTAGLVLIGLSLIAISRAPGHAATTYPGWLALAPTLGTVLVIAAGPASLWNRLCLSRSVMVAIGLISYPLYLWHWPMLSFLRISEQGLESRSMKAVVLLVSIGLAWLTYVVIEQPIRRAVSVRTPWRAAGLAVPLLTLGVVMLAGTAAGTLLPPNRVAVAADDAVPRDMNESLCRRNLGLAGGYCQQYLPTAAPVTTALAGDSHAAHFLPGLGARLAAVGENLVHVGQTQCPPLLDVERLHVTGDATCTRVNREALEAIAARPTIRRVVLSFRTAHLIEAGGEGYADGLGNVLQYRGPASAQAGDGTIVDGLRRTVAYLLDHGKVVTLVMPTPEPGFPITECTGRPLTLSRRPPRTPCGVTQASVIDAQAPFRRVVSALAKEYPIEVVDPLPLLCDGNWCAAVVNGQMLYHDDNHLGLTGSVVASKVFPFPTPGRP
jgi:peptidoglycan/LPS O-acetylase OafA/YrhL